MQPFAHIGASRLFCANSPLNCTSQMRQCSGKMISGAVTLKICAVVGQDCTRSLRLATGSRSHSLPTLIVLALSGIESSRRRLASTIPIRKLTACETAAIKYLAEQCRPVFMPESSVHAEVHIGFAACMLCCMLELIVCNPPMLLPSCLCHWVLQLMHLPTSWAY